MERSLKASIELVKRVSDVKNQEVYFTKIIYICLDLADNIDSFENRKYSPIKGELEQMKCFSNEGKERNC